LLVAHGTRDVALAECDEHDDTEGDVAHPHDALHDGRALGVTEQ
jgi:hypothetical protein